ncbi:MAG: anti-sigma regulatory factor [Leptolyngbyaceae cyanobacterium T60_A2020_046]|nr:anti-sigma regulatory factor [Leptolyngbyaceae cyanobacterium T60_A2020_046]
MVALSPPPLEHRWGSLSFVSTLYLCPILDCLLSNVPRRWRAELRLGLQEALVNAVKHGNRLDPNKVIAVRYTAIAGKYWWVIADEGNGFDFTHRCQVPCIDERGYPDLGDCGRGLHILHQIFDEVHWANDGRELHLCKQMSRWSRLPLVS